MKVEKITCFKEKDEDTNEIDVKVEFSENSPYLFVEEDEINNKYKLRFKTQNNTGWIIFGVVAAVVVVGVLVVALICCRKHRLKSK